MTSFEQSQQGSEGLSVSEAMTRLTGMLQEELRKGAVDVERVQFETIMQKLQAREITPQEALTLGQRIANGRNDYH